MHAKVQCTVVLGGIFFDFGEFRWVRAEQLCCGAVRDRGVVARDTGEALWTAGGAVYSVYGPHSGGLNYNASVTLSPMVNGVHGEGSYGEGGFYHNGGLHYGKYASWGVSAGPLGIASPNNPDGPGMGPDMGSLLNPSLGAYAGYSPGVWFSNARYPSDLDLTERTYSLNVGLGALKAGGISLSIGGGIWQLTLEPPVPPPVGDGIGVDLNVQNTTTHGFK